MQIFFSSDKTQIIFKHETAIEYKWLAKFPAFTKTSSSIGIYNVIPAILPIAHNVIERIKTQKKPTLSPDLKAWLEQPFKLAQIPASFKYHTSPKDFQEIALRFLLTLESAGILLDPGMGKSKVVLDYIFLKRFKRSIIVCPMALLFVWEDEIAKHRPELTYHTVTSTDWEEEQPKILIADVTIINYSKVSILKHRLKETHFDFIHVDEFLIKDPSTNRTKDLTEISRGIAFRAGGSGTLINNSPLDAFSPIRFLQPSLVGFNYTNFLSKYTVQKKLTRNGREQNCIVATRGDLEVKSILESCCIVMTKEEWLKLPPKKFVDIQVTMTDEQRQVYFGLQSNYYAQFKGRDLKVDNPLVMLSKLYQIANGFLYFNEEDPDEVANELLAGDKKPKKKTKRDTVYFDESPKIPALETLLTQTLLGKKAIIWFNMEGELVQIEALLRRLNHNYLVIKGGEKDIGGKVRTFNRSTTIQWAVCQAKSVNYGITVLGSKKEDLEKEGIQVFPDLDPSVCNEVFFSMNFSLEVFSQQQDRIHRLGQENECTYYRLFTNSPVEKKIKKAIENKLSMRETMLVDVANTLMKEEENCD